MENMKKIPRRQIVKNARSNQRVIMVKSIKVRILNDLKAGELFRAQLVNVSSTGSQIYSNKIAEHNTRISLDLDSLDGSHNMTFTGKILWARKNPMKSMGRYAYGIGFEKITPGHTKFLETNYSLNNFPEKG